MLTHPAFPLFVGAVLVALLHGRARIAAALAMPVLALVFVWIAPNGPVWHGHLLGYETVPRKVLQKWLKGVPG